jgi:5S rRNA maturation endonuclease (ribonuclease M5)
MAVDLKFLYKMYQNGKDLEIIPLDHHWYKLFLMNEDHPTKIVRYLDVKNIIPEKDPLHGFFRMSPVNMMVPLAFMDVFIGYLFRGADAKQFTVRPFYPILAYMPVRFLNNLDKFKYNTPIIFVEGVPDAEAVSQFYPYTIAVLGNKIKQMLQKLIPLYTKRVITFFDNDFPGRQGASQSRQQLSDSGVAVRGISYPKDYPHKDQAEMFFKDPKQLEKMIVELNL